MDLTFGKKYFEDSNKTFNEINTLYLLMIHQNNKKRFKLNCYSRNNKVLIKCVVSNNR